MKSDPKTYELKLTEQQKAEVKELTGKDGDVVALTVEELEERIAPKIILN